MKEFQGRASTRVDTMPQTVFDLITDVNRLPEWNTAIEAVVEQPSALSGGAEWTVKMHPPHAPSWKSVSRVEELDRDDTGTEIAVYLGLLPRNIRPTTAGRTAAQAPARARSHKITRRDRQRRERH